jgi:hypothetical protein
VIDAAGLHLIGQDADDLPALSALLQDATLRAVDVAFDARGRRLVALVNRYRREAGGGSRVRAALRIETVAAVQRQGWPGDRDAVLALLALTLADNWLILTFAGAAALRMRIEVVEVLLEDLTDPWPTSREPRHD